ncbi:MAG: hypothetical protein ABJB49_01880 [Nitrospirota bacterium]
MAYLIVSVPLVPLSAFGSKIEPQPFRIVTISQDKLVFEFFSLVAICYSKTEIVKSLTLTKEVCMRMFLVAAVVLSFAFAGFYSPIQAGETKAKTEEMKGEVKSDAERVKGEAKGLKEDIKGNDVKADVERGKGKAKAKGQKAKAKVKEEKARAQ